MRSEKTACILCSRNCGLVVEIEDGQLKRIRGDEEHPVSKGYLCQKAARLDHYQNHADRLRHPLRRQPDGTFVRVSWDEALGDIAQRLVKIRDQHGGKAFATAGGGGQGNHLGGGYLAQIRAAMRSHNAYNSLGQEKTGDFWINGRLFGSQACHTTEDVEHADFVIFLGTNPFQSHGIRNARDTLRDLKNDPARTMVVIDPRRTETAKLADIHLQLKPGTDAFLLSAILSIIVREGLHDREFLAAHCTGFEPIEKALLQVPVAEYVARADVPLADVERVARGFATARSACVRADLGIQHTLHSTLNSYLEKLLYLVTGNFGVEGGNNLHTALIPFLSDTDERNPKIKRTAHHKMFPVTGTLPPTILPDEILLAGEDRVRAVFVDSCNPVLNWPDSKAYEEALRALDLLVVVDVAMTETARLAHYVLPAASQFEKWEFTAFTMEFPVNAFHLRRPLFAPLEEALPEAEIYTRLLERMGEIPSRFPGLSLVAEHEPAATGHLGFMAALAARLASDKKLIRYGASILYRALGPSLPNGAASAALLLPLAMKFASEHPEAVRRASHRGNRATLGSALFRAILEQRSGVVFSSHRYEEVWSLLEHEDGRIHLEIPEMLEVWRALADEPPPESKFPFVLTLGERRSYNANLVYRDPAWRKSDPLGAARMHPQDAARLELSEGAKVVCESARGQIEAIVEIDDSVRPGVVVLPHGYGIRFQDRAPIGPAINRLTASDWCDPLMKTPFHKYVPGNVRRALDSASLRSG